MEAPIYKLRRYHLLALICLGNILAYMTRFSTTVTMLAMDDLNLTTSQAWSRLCLEVLSNFNCQIGGTKTKKNYPFTQMAQIESSFFYGYCLGVAPMGFIADKIGARVLISIAIGGSGAISLLTEVAAKGGVPYFMMIRVFQVRKFSDLQKLHFRAYANRD